MDNNYVISVICNIPHVGMEIPEWAMEDFIVSPEQIQKTAEFMVDKDVYELFLSVPLKCVHKTDISRLVVDTERYRSDADEPMAKLGMGLFYTHDHNGNLIRQKGSTYQKCLELYDEYHKELEDKVTAVLEKSDFCNILDCHSFHDGMEYTRYPTEDFPDVCIGFNDTKPSGDVLRIKEVFEHAGYSVRLNAPFSGSIVPQKYLNDSRVHSVMLELNRRIYCGSEEEFNKVSWLCHEAYYILGWSSCFEKFPSVDEAEFDVF